jgi:hypothetical protein
VLSWSSLYHYVLPVFIDPFSNTTIAFFEEILFPLGSAVSGLLLIYAFIIWVCQLFIRNDLKAIPEQNDLAKRESNPKKKKYSNGIMRLIFTGRPEVVDKWWNRLALVLIYGSTIAVAIILAILLVHEEGKYWTSESYTAYSFESGFAKSPGKEMDCSLYKWG